MDGIILAGGKGTRMLPLTENTPKPLLAIQGRPILEWTLRILRPAASRVLVVANYHKEQIAAFMQAQHIFADYELVEQRPAPLGTGHALQCCQPYLASDDFVVLNGDDLYNAGAIARLAQTPFGILAAEREDAANWGVLLTDAEGRLVRLHEKPPDGLYPTPVKVNTGAYKFSKAVFAYDLPVSARGEYEITDYVSFLVQRHDVDVVLADFWMPIGDPAALEAAQALDLQRLMFDDEETKRC
ncbi:MAG: nucleotidyltransferase family protein [Anaerolineae bacterium]|nr:nucleotidyltransferase family protein [Anaerolineae bacterium]